VQDSGNPETDWRGSQWPSGRSPLAGDLRHGERAMVARKRAPTALGLRWQEQGLGIADAMH
jgi:hypothetical protein